ncbi:MAG: lamin tail domain-containing protein [Ferruginibacter sp.]
MKKNYIHILFFLLASVALKSFSQAPVDVFISEYVEGSSNNKAVELYNPTNNTINLGADVF